MSGSRKRVRDDAEGQEQPAAAAAEENVAPVAAAAAAAASSSSSSSSSSTPSAKQSRVGEEPDVCRSRSASAAAESAAYQREVETLRLRFQRRLHTDQLIAKISTGGTAALAKRIKDYREEMKKDAARDVSMLDPNYQDAKGKTLLMHVISLFGAMCGTHGGVALNQLDIEGVREHLDSLIDRSDIRLRTESGLDSLCYLAHHIVVNAQIYTDWFVVTKLVSMAKARGLLDTRDASGCTPFLHWCGSGPTPNVLQLLVDAGCDIEAVDALGNTGLHKLVRSHNHRALEALASSQHFLERIWCVKNRSGLTPLDLAAFQMAEGHSPQAVLIHRMLSLAHEEWKAGLAPLLFKQLVGAVVLPDLARLVVEYLDGSGKDFKQPESLDEECRRACSRSPLPPPAAAAASSAAAAAAAEAPAAPAAAAAAANPAAMVVAAVDSDDDAAADAAADPIDISDIDDDDDEVDEEDIDDFIGPPH